MPREIISKIISAIEKGVEEKGSHIALNNEKHEIRKENFRPITDLARGKIVFVDGGNAELLSAPNFSLHFVRVFAAVYENNRRKGSEKTEFYALAFAKEAEGRIFYEIRAFGDDIDFEKVDSEDSSMMMGKHKVSAQAAVDLCRRFAEIRMAGRMAEKANGGVIVIDGNLEASRTGEKKEIDAMLSRAEKNGGAVCGLSKTTRMLTEKGNSAAAAVNSIAPEGEWYYEVCEGVNLAKLHKNAKHVFRMDIGSRAKDAASLLKQNSKDPVFLGYPYGLIEADRLARISNNEAECLRMMIVAKAGKSFDKIKTHLNSLNAHSILDSIS